MLIPQLSEEEISFHKKLIDNSILDLYSLSPDFIEVLGCGSQKGVYQVGFGSAQLIAIAASKNRKHSFFEEYRILYDVFSEIPDLVPRPKSHYVFDKGNFEGEELIFMECLPHKDLNLFRLSSSYQYGREFNRDLAYEIGKQFTRFNLATKRIISEPHDGNILGTLNEEGEIELKFCDPIQMINGNLESGIRCILSNKDERPECFRFIHKFYLGIKESLESHLNLSDEEIRNMLKFMGEYNPIF